jgi:putative ABC transport system ATP-binding protein
MKDGVCYRIEDLVKSRGHGAERFTLVVRGLEVRAGERVAVVGPSGSGKSTLLDVLGLIAQPDRARAFGLFVEAGMVDVARLWREGQRPTLARLRASSIGYVMQTGALLSFARVGFNLALPAAIAGRPGVGARLAEALGLAPLLGRHPRALSVGERQRVAVARALSHRPQVVLADEPTAALDQANAEAVMGLLVEQVERQGATAVLVTHDRDLPRRFGFRLVDCEPEVGASRSTVAG